MAALENYKKLGTVGTAYKGEYQSGQKYKYANTVYFKGSTYIALKDDPEGEPTDDGINWKYFAKGMDGGAIPEKEKGVPNGVATLDENGKIQEEQLPDDIGVDLAVVSDKFSTDKDYATGEYCIYEDVLYKFTSPKEPGEWDEAVVEATNVVTELASLNSNLTFKSVKVKPSLSTLNFSIEVYYSKIMKVITFGGEGSTITGGKWIDIAILPDEAKPIVPVYKAIYFNANPRYGWFRVNTNGTVSIYIDSDIGTKMPVHVYEVYI